MNRPAETLNDDETARYQRQTVLPEIGAEGQLRLKRCRVLIVGAGGLGSPAAMYLAAAGVGALGILDPDRVEISNLQRQILHGDADLDREKTVSAAERLRAINPHCEISVHNERLTAKNAAEFIDGYDMVLGCVDNFAARDHINTACVALGKPNIFGAAARFDGQASVFCLPEGPCYRCFFRNPPDDAKTLPIDKGVLGTVPGVIGCIQANEAIKIVLGIGGVLSGRLLLYDALTMRFREIMLKKDPECPVCGPDRAR